MAFAGVERSKLAVIAAVAAALALGIVAQYLLVERQDVTWGLIFWGVASAIFLVGIWQGMRVSADTPALGDEPTVQERAIRPRTEIVLFLSVIAVGIFFRLYRLDTIPPGLNHDAAWNGLHAIRITNGLDFAPYVGEAWGRETMFHYMVALSQLLFGQTQFAIQITAVTIGAGTLGAFYILMRRLFDTRLALIATFLLSVSGWHLTFSRVGWRTILVPLFVALLFYFLTKALEERHLRLRAGGSCTWPESLHVRRGESASICRRGAHYLRTLEITLTHQDPPPTLSRVRRRVPSNILSPGLVRAESLERVHKEGELPLDRKPDRRGW